MRTTLGALLALGSLSPTLLLAQGARGGGGGAMVARRAPLNSACAELALRPTTLVNTPEGRALVRLKTDLVSATALAGSELQVVELQRKAQVERTLDSLMRMMVRTTRSADSVRGQALITLRGPEGERVTFDARAARSELEQTIRVLEPQVQRFVSEMGRRTMVRIPAPTGWMGVTLSQSSRELPSPEGMLTYYCDYPVIETVTAGSPAAKGGLQAGDTVVAYNGRDVRASAVNLASLLVPQRVVRVRVKRDGREREIPLTIAARPVSGSVSFIREACAPGVPCAPHTFVFSTDSVRGFSSRPAMAPRSPSEFGPSRVFVTTGPSLTIAGERIGSGPSMFAGAQMAVIDDVLASSLGLEPGVLVMHVLPGSIAAEAGLRPGEVIRALNGAPVRDLLPLQRAVSLPGVRELRLTVSERGAEPRIVTVKW